MLTITDALHETNTGVVKTTRNYPHATCSRKPEVTHWVLLGRKNKAHPELQSCTESIVMGCSEKACIAQNRQPHGFSKEKKEFPDGTGGGTAIGHNGQDIRVDN